MFEVRGGRLETRSGDTIPTETSGFDTKVVKGDAGGLLHVLQGGWLEVEILEYDIDEKLGSLEVDEGLTELHAV